MPKVIAPVVFIVMLFRIPPVVVEFVDKVPVPFRTMFVVPTIVPEVIELAVKLPPTKKVFPVNVKIAETLVVVKLPLQVKLDVSVIVIEVFPEECDMLSQIIPLVLSVAKDVMVRVLPDVITLPVV